MTDTLTPAAKDVLAERARQLNEERWDYAWDDLYDECELARAAATYAICTKPEQLTILGVICWPWQKHWWKPTTYRQNLVKAGALILAEIERLDRAEVRGAK